MSKTKAEGQKNISDRLILGMGAVYILFLIWAILWKCGIPFIGDGSERIINLLPFNGNTGWEMQFNIAGFIPFGFYLAASKPNISFTKRILVTLLTSLAFEAVQFAFAVGRSDVTDLLMNTLGGFIGTAICYVLSKLLCKNERKAILIVCVFLTLIELYMAVSFICFGQLNIGLMIIRL